MKSNSILTYLLALSLLMGVWFFWLQIAHTRELRKLNPQLMSCQQYQAGKQGLFMECLEYSKRNPAIDPILQQVNLKPGGPAPAPNTTPKPAAK